MQRRTGMPGNGARIPRLVKIGWHNAYHSEVHGMERNHQTGITAEVMALGDDLWHFSFPRPIFPPGGTR